MSIDKFRKFDCSISEIPLPEKFTFPFCYKPHELCILACVDISNFLAQQPQWQAELNEGKMFGVLIVKNKNDEIGYIAAFSGNLDGKNQHEFFVPPVYDMLQPNDFFKVEEEKISAINKQIELLEKDDIFLLNKHNFSTLEIQVKQDLHLAKENLKTAKISRDNQRKKGVNEIESANFIAESQYQKAEYKRLEKQYKQQLQELQTKINEHQSTIDELKRERKNRSAHLQQKLFEQFEFLNARGITKNLCEIFANTVYKIPPAGAGECAAPKLLQYAYSHKLKPVAMAEFWYGNSPKNEIRRHGNFYPACKGKCQPILQHMLEGLCVEENPLENEKQTTNNLNILYEDDYVLAINKLAGMLSVSGKSKTISVQQIVKEKYPQIQSPMIVHRLDMDTSGVMIIAKTFETYRNLQKQFKNREVRKKYIALLDGEIAQSEGSIELPLCSNVLDRPHQTVDFERGKSAVTKFKILGYEKNFTRVEFFPLTGRTHQLRVHAAHSLGLNCAIVGDNLYGKSADRLYLHAESIEFSHPVTNKKIIIEVESTF